MLACAVATWGCSCGATVLGDTGAHDDAGGAAKKPDSGREGAPSDAAGLDAYTPDLGVRSRSGSQIAVLGVRSEDAEAGATDPVLSDKKHDVVCSIEVTADGKARCLPANSNVFFRDATCTQPIAKDFLDNCDPDAPFSPYGVESWSGATVCDRARLSVYTIGAVVPAPPVVYKQTVFGCAEDTVPFAGSYREATPAPLDEWVKFDRRTVKVTDRLGVSTWSGSDGSLMVLSLAVLPQDVACGAATQGASSARCVPSDRLEWPNSGGTHFADVDCQSALAARCEPNPVLMEGFDTPNTRAPGVCAPRSFPEVGPLFQVGNLVDHSEIHIPLGDLCITAPSEALIGAFSYYSAGAPVRFEDYPIVGEILSGTGRLQQVVYVAEDGTKLFSLAGVFYDTVSKVYCYPQDLLGRTVCVPRNAVTSTGGFWADSQCSRRLAFPGECGTAVAASVVEERTRPDGNVVTCSSSLHRITPYSGPVFEKFELQPCGPIDLQFPATTYEVGERVEPDALFPPLERFDY